MSYPRPLDATEKAVLLRVFELAGVPDAAVLRRQVEHGIAAWPCECPCPSVALDVDREHAEPIAREGRLDIEVYYDEGAVMVWVDHGWLSNLEMWWWSDATPTAFPPIESLRATPP